MVQKPTPKTKHKNGISRNPKSTIPFSWVSRGPPCYRFVTGWMGEKTRFQTLFSPGPPGLPSGSSLELQTSLRRALEDVTELSWHDATTNCCGIYGDLPSEETHETTR